ncbi:hypothetical protein D3C87_2080860 [compost metagenome]
MLSGQTGTGIIVLDYHRCIDRLRHTIKEHQWHISFDQFLEVAEIGRFVGDTSEQAIDTT